MKKFLLIVALFSVICNGCYELDFDTDFHSGIYEKRYSRIYYTTSDNRPIELGKLGTSLVNRVVSNTYSNGQGVLVFEDIVTKIEEYTFYHCENLTSLKIPESVTKIGYQAFSGCNRLEKIDIPNSVTTIGNSAFEDCSSLTSVTIPDSVTTIGNYAFSGCTGELVVDCNIPSASSFYGSKFTSVTIGDSVTTIGKSAFKYYSSLTSVTIGDSVTTIGDYAFYECSSLTSVYCKATTPPAGGNYMFEYNASGRKIYVPMELIEAYKSASGWSQYADAILGYDFENGEIEGFMMEYTSSDGYKVTPYNLDAFDAQLIGNYCINGKGYLYFDREITKIGIDAFYNCKNLNNITIPDSVTTIGNYAFSDCSSLTSLTIPDSVTTIGDWAFSYCSSLTSVTIPNSVTTIGWYVFYGCSSLTSVTIGDSVTTIGIYAFSGCSSLTSVYCKATTPPAAGNNMFYGNASGRKIYVPMESVEAYKSASYWSNYASYIVGYNF